ncbi:hypothetical protein [Methanogenium sp. MK-MG]|nr:hypothetical protein [Methanogenium sp. MK-MG]
MGHRVKISEGDTFIGTGDVLADGSVVIDIPFTEEFPDEDDI